MSKPNRRKRAKKIERQRRLTSRKHSLALESRWPRLHICPDDAPAGLVKLVRDARTSFDFANKRGFSAPLRAFYKNQRNYGFELALALFWGNDWESTSAWEQEVMCAYLENMPGIVLLKLIPQRRLTNYVPMTNIEVRPNEADWLISFRSLATKKSPYGTIYFSKRKPTIKIGGVEKIVGFTRHAIQQTCARVVTNWRGYMGLGDAFAIFDGCIYYEPVVLPSGQLAFTFYSPCQENHFSWKYVANILDRPLEGRRYYYRVGYCPAAVEGDHVVAKTLLCPGFRGTPEHHALTTARLGWADRRALMGRRSALTKADLLQHHDFTLLRWFHEHGVPQVREFQGRLYARD